MTAEIEMNVSETTPLLVTGLLASSIFFTGMSAASIAPYRAITALDALGMHNSTYAFVITISSLATALASLLLGNLSDRIGDRRMLVIVSSVLGALAYGLIYLFPYKAIYIISFCLVLPFGGALFSQTFSFSRAYYDLNAPARSEFMTSVLRSIFSAAWVIVPPAAGFVAAKYSVFDVFGVAALAHLVCTLIFGLLLARSDAHVPPPARAQGRELRFWRILPTSRLIGISGVTLLRIAIVLHLTVLPLAIVNDFRGTLKDVGFNAALAAGLEVPFMLGWGVLAARWPKERILVINGFIYGSYLILIVFARSMTDVYILQVPNAIATAALMSITISYMQETIKGRVGLSTALMDVVTVISALVAAATFALLSTKTSHLAVFMAAGGLSCAGAVILALSRIMTTRNSGTA